MPGRLTSLILALGLLVLAAAGVWMSFNHEPRPATKPHAVPSHAEQAQRLLFDAIQPVKLANCELERFGEQNDGGYLLCGNLLGDAQSAYSYGISGYDQWGCDVSKRLKVPVHEYDCFDLTRPSCPGGRFEFHAECIGGSRRTDEGRVFDTLENQIRRNGDSGKYLIVKMDVEGSEWESLLGAPDQVLQQIDQMAVEFHGFEEERFLHVIWKLKQFFHVVNLHWNNYECERGRPPYPSAVYEILLVNKRIGVPDPGAKPVMPNPLDQPNRPGWPDCQIPAAM